MYCAFWIAPRGKIINVETRHIHKVCESPGLFNISDQYMKKVTRKHGYPYEGGPARNVIMSDLIKRGWIRVRRHERGFQHWRIQIEAKTTIPENVKRNLLKFAGYLMKKDKDSGNDNVIIINLRQEVLYGGFSMNEWRTVSDLYKDL